MTSTTVPNPAARPRTAPSRLLLASVFVVATSGLVYELVAGTIAGYFLGNAVLEFAFVLGVYLSALGAGSALSAHLRGSLTARFIEVETGVALLGGTSAALLFYAFARLPCFRIVLYVDTFLVGALVGIELPILLRLLREDLGFDESVVSGLTFDYLGSLAASIVFPLVLVPFVGIVRGAACFGILNALVAAVGGAALPGPRRHRAYVVVPLVAASALAVMFGFGDALVRATAD